MLKIIVFLLFASLAGCGQGQWSEPGISGSAEQLEEFPAEVLSATFYQTKQCMGVEFGEFQDVSITIVDDLFFCVAENSIGCFWPSNNIVFVGTTALYYKAALETFKHEVIHYLLYLNSENADPAHTSVFFSTCTYI